MMWLRQQDYGGFGGLVHDTTDNGTVWDPIKNYYGYWYSAQNGFVAAQGTSVSTNYLNFPGQWGGTSLFLSSSEFMLTRM